MKTLDYDIDTELREQIERMNVLIQERAIGEEDSLKEQRNVRLSLSAQAKAEVLRPLHGTYSVVFEKAIDLLYEMSVVELLGQSTDLEAVKNWLMENVDAVIQVKFSFDPYQTLKELPRWASIMCESGDRAKVVSVLRDVGVEVTVIGEKFVTVKTLDILKQVTGF